jgi:RNA polymerase sigma-70 factor (ECF subfamily)
MPLKKIAEDELVISLRNKDGKAMEYLYDNYSPALFGVIRNIVDDKETAEDILQEVFVKIWKNISSYDKEKGKFFTWMLNIARNAAIDMLRSKKFQKSTKNRPLANSVNYINRNLRSENYVDAIGLRKILDQLKPELKMIIDLLYFGGYTQSEVAEEFSIPLGTVKTRTRMALMELRKILGP